MTESESASFNYLKTVTVLMPAYNAEKFLPQAIESILNQTYQNFIFLIINDGSIDDTEKIVLSYKDHRIRYIKNTSNLGLIDTLNKGIQMTETEYLIRMDADDIAMPERLEKQIFFMNSNQKVLVCGSQVQYFGQNDIVTKFPLHHNAIFAGLIFTPKIIHPTVIMRIQKIKELNLFYEKKFYLIEDYEFWFRLARVGELANLPDVLLKYRWDGQNITARNWSSRLDRYRMMYREIMIYFHLDSEKSLNNHLILSSNSPEAINIYEVRSHMRTLRNQNSELNLFDKTELNNVLNDAWDKLFYKIINTGFLKVLRYFFISRKIKAEHFKYLLAYYLRK